MSRPEDLIQACQSRLALEGISDTVDAAGAFAIQDDYKARRSVGATETAVSADYPPREQFRC